jgi:hypothetical protein
VNHARRVCWRGPGVFLPTRGDAGTAGEPAAQVGLERPRRVLRDDQPRRRCRRTVRWPPGHSGRPLPAAPQRGLEDRPPRPPRASLDRFPRKGRRGDLSSNYWEKCSPDSPPRARRSLTVSKSLLA